MTGVLAGYRIIDLSQLMSGPAGTVVLADQGADVIKIESRHGDGLRPAGCSRNGIGSFFLGYNRNKRSIVLDLKQKEGLDLLKRLVADADVFVQNFRAGVCESLGVGPDALRGVKPDLIYVSITGFGETGPYAHKPVYDPIIQGLAGYPFSQMGPSDARPSLVRMPVVDKVTGLVVAQAITAALCERERTKKGRHVEIAMLDVAVNFIWPEFMGEQTFLEGAYASAASPAAGEWMQPTADGQIISITGTDDQFERLARALGRLEWLEDARFRTLRDRVNNLVAFSGELMKAFLGKTSEDWIAILEAADVPVSRVLTPDAVIKDTQIAHNEILVESDHPRAGRIRQCLPAARFDGARGAVRAHAPLIGENTDEILTEIGVSADEISKLKAARVIG